MLKIVEIYTILKTECTKKGGEIMVGRKITVSNPSGLHIKPAGQLVKAAERCSSRVEIIYDYSIINARSLLNILSAAIPHGAEIELRCTGPDEKEDLETMTEAMGHLE